MDIVPIPADGFISPLNKDLVPIPLDGFDPQRHAPSVYLASLAPGSRRAMKGALETAAGLLTGGRCNVLTLPWYALRFEHTAALRAALGEKFAPSTANKVMSAIRGTLKSAWRLGQIPTEDYQRAIDIQSIKGNILPSGRMLSGGELMALFQVCATENGGSGSRDAAILAVLAGAGLRRSEVVALDRKDYNRDTGEIKIRRGKGNKARVAFLGSTGREAMENYLKHRGETPGPLFVPLKRGRPPKPVDGVASKRGLDVRGVGLNDQALMDILIKRTDQAGIDDVSPHDFRRTFISNALEAGADISTIQQLVGHASPATTARYDRRGDEAKKRTAELVAVPYVRPASANPRTPRRR